MTMHASGSAVGLCRTTKTSTGFGHFEVDTGGGHTFWNWNICCLMAPNTGCYMNNRPPRKADMSLFWDLLGAVGVVWRSHCSREA